MSDEQPGPHIVGRAVLIAVDNPAELVGPFTVVDFDPIAWTYDVATPAGRVWVRIDRCCPAFEGAPTVAEQLRR